MSEKRKQATYALFKRTSKLLQCDQCVIIFEATASRAIVCMIYTVFWGHSGKIHQLFRQAWETPVNGQLANWQYGWFKWQGGVVQTPGFKQGDDVSTRWNRWNTPSQFHLNLHHLTCICIYSIIYWDISPIQSATIVHIKSTAISYSKYKYLLSPVATYRTRLQNMGIDRRILVIPVTSTSWMCMYYHIITPG